MEIQKAFLHHIEQSLNELFSVDIDSHYKDIEPIVKSIIDEIFEGKNKRACAIPPDNNTLGELVKAISSSDIEAQKTAVLISSQRLLRKERDAQEQYGAITQIPKGSLFHILVEHNQKIYFIITKTDHDKFLDESELETRRGIPLNKKTYKSFYCEVIDGQLVDAYIYDPSGRSARYWWEGYLDVVLCNSDAQNTEKVLNHLLEKIIYPIRAKSPDDYKTLRDSTITFFRSHQEFSLSEYLVHVWEHYVPISEGLSLDKYKDKVNRMSDNKKFDTSFTIIASSINRRVKRNVQLTPKMKLHIDDMTFQEEKDIVVPFTDDKGKWIKIKTDSGYEYFRRNESD
ncbi:nucleoid-associated protein [Parabacteroides goldsteinii]|uniref:nucleoid-associated protein n=1 Tax=Parabacteroides goldsteinii TaxID=328812 RepID=UPI001CCE650B|nr:nucleoid-associated protein [Parabacteroides goldsteinii]UBD76213.1 nucleoid-associated protein [Parabacteroides goldsteinii]